ncbi:MAG TPA: TraR/DksA family transcriptional regulator [Rhodanobacteraceae bacterium]|nr:TraR/DksA family transcriptional regulator [Rhodanobacteraceae bacterium]
MNVSNRNAGLSDEFVERQRVRLETLRNQLLGGEAHAVRRERRFQEERGNEASEFEEAAQDMARHEVNQALHDVDDHRLHRIERALQKIEEGTYGLSDVSGDPIPQARLEATPESIVTTREERKQEAGG